MKKYKHGMTTALKEHLLKGNPTTSLEAFVLFGISNIPQLISSMRKSGFVIESRRVPFAVGLKRINEHALLEPPKNLPVREIQLTEYWVNR